MFEKVTYQCPNCGAAIRQELEDGKEVACLACDSRYRVMLDEDTGKAGFVPVSAREVPEPLYLPKGSIRAIITIALASSCWTLILIGREVPGYLLSLLLTIIGYYFGFRKKLKTAQSRILDASAKEEEPLFLPHGFIRVLLIAGFLVSGLALYSRGRLGELHYVEFFVILSGLALGYLYAKTFASYDRGAAYVSINHFKGGVVLGAAVYLAFLLLSGKHADFSHLALLLSAIISFYFGSRS